MSGGGARGADLPAAGVEDAPVRSLAPAYAGRTRATQLEYEAVLANASIGIAFTRDRKFFLCNPKFAEMFGWPASELIGQPGEVVYPSAESYAALGEIAIPVLSQGRQLDVEWEMRRRDGSTFPCRIVAKALDPDHPQQGTVWIGEDVTERKRQADEMARLLAEQRATFEAASIGIVFARERRIVRCNRRVEEMFGYGAGELVDRPARQLHVDDAFYDEIARSYEVLAQGGGYSAEGPMRRRDGSAVWVRVNGSLLDPGDPARGSVWMLEDITERRRAEEALRGALAEQALIFGNATIGIAFVRERSFQRCNPRMEEMFGYAPRELIGQSTRIVYPSDADFEEIGRDMYAVLGRGERDERELQLRRKDGSLFWCRQVGRAIDPQRARDGGIWIYEDISAERVAREASEASREALEASREALEQAVASRTAELEAANARLQAEIGERAQAEARAQHLADHDALTGLPNRRLLEDRLGQAIALGKRNQRQTAAMFIDLDRFKSINDSLGHAVGDGVLKEVASRLVRQLRRGDTICRVGGDEFVVVLPEIRRAADAANVAQKVLEQLSVPVVVDGHELATTPSIGIAVYPDDGTDAEALLRNADAAMYHVKETGRASYQFFTEQMNQIAARRLDLEAELRRALREGELRLFVQPIVSIADGEAVGHEVLLRWQHPARGLLLPGDFLQYAEDSGLILRLDEWVLAAACAWARARGTALPVAVNISARQLNDAKLYDVVSRALQGAGLGPAQLELEISESAAMHQTDVAMESLRRLGALGVSVTIDDVGTGASRLAALRRSPVRRLKIDCGLISDAMRDLDDRAVVAAIIAFAHALGLAVVAEGVESEAQRDWLREEGCDLLQGYLAGAPEAIDTAGAGAPGAAQAPG